MDAKKIRETADNLFSKRTSLLGLWQETSENFYPERADFTLKRYLGTDFAGNLTTSYPVLCRRDLGDQIGTMLRNTAKTWFHMVPVDTRLEDNEAKRWLEWAEGTMRRAMYDKKSLFNRATKECDNDFATFGQGVIEIDIAYSSPVGPHLLYRCYHLRDVVWMEDAYGQICFIARKWKIGARDLYRLFGDKVDPKVKTMVERGKVFDEIECYHIVCAADMYDGDAKGRPWYSIYYDLSHDKLIEDVAVWNKKYLIPRWQTVSGSQYAFSPATVAGLPDARLLQAITYTLLEAGEKAANPPMVATVEAVRSDIAIYAGGVTWVDLEYDERLGEALRPLNQDFRGMPIGAEQSKHAQAMLMQAFYLNKLSLPQRAPDMTAYEVGQRVQEYIRGAMPLFEPMESDYNGALCEETFDQLRRAGTFGSPFDMPKSLHGADIEFRFESPLHDVIEQQKGQKWLEAKAIIADAVALDRSTMFILDAKVALRDVLDGIGVPAKWQRSESEVADQEQAAKKQQDQQQMLAAMQQGSEVAANLGQAHKSFAEGSAAAPA